MSGNFHFLSRATTRSGAFTATFLLSPSNVVGIGPEAPRAGRDPLYPGKRVHEALPLYFFSVDNVLCRSCGRSSIVT
jgi:hypothetical protein